MRKYLSTLVILVLCMVLSGCNSTDSNLENTIKTLKNENSQLKNENDELKAQIEAMSKSDNGSSSETVDSDEATSAKNENKVTKIEIGDTIKNDKVEINIKNIELSYDVLPDDTSGFYTHYQSDTGNVYIHIDTDVKNLQKQNLECDKILTVAADYNDGFTYTGFAVPEDTSTGFTYANITTIKPLETLGVRFLIDCPQEVEESDNSLYLTFKVDKNNYIYVIR